VARGHWWIGIVMLLLLAPLNLLLRNSLRTSGSSQTATARPVSVRAVVVQGFLGYGLVSVIGAIPADIFQGARTTARSSAL
jgi:hypothetical protein